MTPAVGLIVHYVSYGTPGGEYGQECRAAVITEVDDREPVPEHGVPYVGLCVLNPTGQFFNQHVKYHDGAGQPGRPDCGMRDTHGDPHRYCSCGWTEPAFVGGTWHWLERVEQAPAPQPSGYSHAANLA